MRYASLGDVPAKRHVQFRENGTLLTEEVLGFEGFSGNESILYHLWSPCRVKEVGAFEPIVREEWVPDTHVHRLTDTNPVEPGGDWLDGRRLLQFNNDIEVSICKPTEECEGFYRNGEGDEVLFIHHGTGIVETIFGDVPYRPHDYVVIPRGTTYRVGWTRRPATRLAVLLHAGRDRDAQPLPQPLRPAARARAVRQRDFHPPRELRTHRERGEFELTVRVRDGYQPYLLDYHPFDVVGWDGYVYPYTFNTDDFEPITGRIHMPPPVHQTFQGQNFVICSFCPRELDYDPQAIPLPYHHSNVQSEEAIYYVDGQFGSRKGVDVGMITLHPSGLPHGPQPGLVEASLGARRTEELAVMWDTFKPLQLTTLARDLDQPRLRAVLVRARRPQPAARATTGFYVDG